MRFRPSKKMMSVVRPEISIISTSRSERMVPGFEPENSDMFISPPASVIQHGGRTHEAAGRLPIKAGHGFPTSRSAGLVTITDAGLC